MTQHTQGPWTFYADTPSTEPNWHIVTTANRMRVIANVHIEPHSEMDLANARLIASAPDLLAALIALDEAFCSCNNTSAERHQSRLALIAGRAAVAKATGAA